MELAKNRKAFYDYEILETFEGGLVLQGTEVKSLRNHGGNLAESYVRIIKNEAWLLGASIAPYRFGNIQNHQERRDRKVLLHKKEIQKLREASHQKGLTIVPLALYLKQGRVKIKIAIGRGKKGQDKRQTIIARDRKREMDRAMKNR